MRVNGLRRVAFGLVCLAAFLAIATAPASGHTTPRASSPTKVKVRFLPYLSDSPSAPGYVNGESPSVSTIMLGATVGGLITVPEAGKTVRFKVVSGPNAGRTGKATTDSGSYPNKDVAFFKYSDTGGVGVDKVEAITGSGGNQTTDTIQMTWAQPTQCEIAVGFLGAMKCAYSVGQKVLDLGECSLSIASFLTPAGDFVKVLKAASDWQDAERLIKDEHLVSDAADATPVAKLAADLRQLGGTVSPSLLYKTFSDAKSAKSFINDLWSIMKSVDSAKYAPILTQVAALLGLQPCIDLLSNSVIPLAPTVTPAPAPVPTPPTVTIPAQGPTLVDTESVVQMDSPSDTTFGDFSSATGQAADVVDTLPPTLSGYRCVILEVNTAFASGDLPTLQAYLAAGGTVLAIGEHEGGDFDLADAALNGIASQLGADGLSLNDDSYDSDGDEYTDSVAASPWTVGVGELGDNWVSSLTVNPPAQPLVYTADDDSVPFIGYQQVGAGTFVMSGDSNVFSDDNDGFYLFEDNGTFAADLCP
jgi:hypothetical protein